MNHLEDVWKYRQDSPLGEATPTIGLYQHWWKSPCLVAHKREETSRSFAERAVGIAPLNPH
jgi:hypothetical protein